MHDNPVSGDWEDRFVTNDEHDQRMIGVPKMFALVIGALFLTAVLAHRATGTPWWATTTWVVFFATPGVAVLVHFIDRGDDRSRRLGPVVFAVLVLSWVLLGQA